MTRTPTRTVLRLGVAAVLALIGAAAGSIAAAGPAAAAQPSYVRLAHLSPDTPNVDVYMTSYTRPDWKLVIRGVGYGAVSAYQRLQPDRYAVSMRPAGAPASSPPVLSTNVNAASGKAFTVAGVGPYADLGLAVISDDLTLPKQGDVRVRVLQGSARAKTVAVQAVNGPPVASGIAFAKSTPYAEVPAGRWTLQVSSTDQADLKATSAVTLSAGAVYSLVVLDAPDGGLTLATHADAISAAVTPSGAVETGGGGTAPRPGAPGRLPLGASGLGAVLLAAACFALVRSRRTAAAPRR
ncbi:MAG TPA: DUF4397 domain-containing protein [Mycobacteriales bacterium]|nr:DUF4397 domain-containing protein [Mycobacteriales bacterium]